MVELAVKQAILDTSLPAYLDSDELEILMAHVTLVSFSAGDVILQQGQHSAGIHIIIDGHAFISARTLEFEKSDIAALTKGDFIGEISLLLNEPSSASIIANNNMQCLFISKVYLDFLAAFFPMIKSKTLLAIANKICLRIIDSQNKIINYMEISDMAAPSILERVMTSLKNPAMTTFEEAGIDVNKLKPFIPFSMFDQDELDELLKHVALEKAVKNCTLIKESQENPMCYIVIYGGVQSSIIHDNRIAKLSVIGPNTLFCNTQCVNKVDTPKINFTTCEHSLILRLTEADLNFLQKEQAKIWSRLFDMICKSLVSLERSVQKLNIRLNIELYNR